MKKKRLTNLFVTTEIADFSFLRTELIFESPSNISTMDSTDFRKGFEIKYFFRSSTSIEMVVSEAIYLT